MSNETARVTSRYECGGCGREFEMDTEPSDAGMTSTCPHCGRVDNECAGTDEPEEEPFTLRCILAEGVLGEELAYREARLEAGTAGRQAHRGGDAGWIAVRRLKKTKRPSWEEFDLCRSRLMKPSADVYTAPSGTTRVEGGVWFLEADRDAAEMSLRVAVREALMRYEALVGATFLSEIAAFRDFQNRRTI